MRTFPKKFSFFVKFRVRKIKYVAKIFSLSMIPNNNLSKSVRITNL